MSEYCPGCNQRDGTIHDLKHTLEKSEERIKSLEASLTAEKDKPAYIPPLKDYIAHCEGPDCSGSHKKDWEEWKRNHDEEHDNNLGLSDLQRLVHKKWPDADIAIHSEEDRRRMVR